MEHRGRRNFFYSTIERAIYRLRKLAIIDLLQLFFIGPECFPTNKMAMRS